MKLTYLIEIFMAFAINGFGQVSTENMSNHETIDTNKPCNPENILLKVDKKPKYNGGIIGLESDLYELIKPDIQIKGTIYLQFVVNCMGQLSGIKVLRGLNLETDSRMIEALKNLQNWQPGYLQVPVDSLMNFVIKIRNGKIYITEIQ